MTLLLIASHLIKDVTIKLLENRSKHNYWRAMSIILGLFLNLIIMVCCIYITIEYFPYIK